MILHYTDSILTLTSLFFFAISGSMFIVTDSMLCDAGLFVALGLSGVIPAGHFVITDGLSHAFDYAALGWVILMAFLYIIGAVIYAARIPERIWPGRFDIWVRRLVATRLKVLYRKATSELRSVICRMDHIALPATQHR